MQTSRPARMVPLSGKPRLNVLAPGIASPISGHGALAGGLAALCQSEANYRSFFELNPCPMWICDENTLKFLDVNEAALRLYGWSRRAFLQMTAKNIRPLEDAPKFLRAMAGQRRSRVLFVGEWRHVKRDGTIFDVAVTTSCVDYNGREARLVLVNDITERKRAEAQLKQLNATLERRVAERTRALTGTNERLQAIMDTALVGILTLDGRGIIESFNLAVLQMFGYSPGEITGRNFGRLLVSPSQARRENFLDHYLQARKRQFLGGRNEALGRCKDGRVLMLELTLTEFTHQGQKRFVATVRDITLRKRLERELLEISERERQRIGQDLHDCLGQQLHGLSYLAALLAKDLRQDDSPREIEAAQLNKHLNEALELTRGIAHGLQPVKSLPEGLMMALRELAGHTQRLYRVDCRFECRARVLIQRHSAAVHLYRIAQEAVSNAMKHGQATRVCIQLAATPKLIILGVRDNGVGIRRRTRPGRGMGLHFMQYRANAINGLLTVQKLPWQGTEVVCIVPRRFLLASDNEIK